MRQPGRSAYANPFRPYEFRCMTCMQVPVIVPEIHRSMLSVSSSRRLSGTALSYETGSESSLGGRDIVVALLE